MAEFYNYNILIVTADIDGGLAQRAEHDWIVRFLDNLVSEKSKTQIPNSPTIQPHPTTMINLPALVKCHPLYILLRVSRELCFW